MRIAFRTDASIEIGNGHVMRCITLADALREQGVECVFICRPHCGHLLDLIVHRGHEVLALPSLTTASPSSAADDPRHARWLGTDWYTDATHTQQVLGRQAVDWLVVDHYGLDYRWELALHPNCKHLMVIDDLADRTHVCDLLLDQNLGRLAQDYGALLPPNTPILIGPQFALLRPEFSRSRGQSLARRFHPQLKQLLVTMGGVDKDNATSRILDELANCHLPDDLQITVVLGPHAPWRELVQTKALKMPRKTQLLVNANDMSQLMAESDLAIGAAGGTAWERCCLGLPSLIVVLASNQYTGAIALQKAGAALAIQDMQQIGQFLQSHLLTGRMASVLHGMSEAAAQITDGQGTSSVMSKLMNAYG